MQFVQKLQVQLLFVFRSFYVFELLYPHSEVNRRRLQHLTLLSHTCPVVFGGVVQHSMSSATVTSPRNRTTTFECPRAPLNLRIRGSILALEASFKYSRRSSQQSSQPVMNIYFTHPLF
jgi:hypothetical protein